MSLIKCPDCGEVVSKKATSCPKCGRVIKKESHLFRNLFFILIIIIGIAIYSDQKKKEFVSEEWWITATLDMVHKKITDGIDINLQNEKNGKTPLMFAIEKQNTDIVNLLLKNGANVNKTNIFGENSLIFALKTSNKELVELIINQNVRVDNQDINGKTALIYAIETNKDISLVELLLNKKANINIRTNNGMTPLMYASKFAHNKDIIVYLIKNGAQINDIDDDNKTAVDYAKNNKHLENKLVTAMQKFLLSKSSSQKYSQEEVLTDCKQAKEQVLKKFYEIKGENLTIFHKTKVIDFASDGVMLEQNCYALNTKWIFPELRNLLKNCNHGDRVFVYTDDTEYVKNEAFRDGNYLYYRDGIFKYTTVIGATNSVPAFRKSGHKINELNYKNYLHNRNLNCN